MYVDDSVEWRHSADVNDAERQWLEDTCTRFGGQYPSLEELWKLMDEEWDRLACDPNVMDERIGKFYSHPVWLMNGLFIEQHDQSLAYREQFTDWIVQQKPKRVADFGGGFGSLARMLGRRLPDATIDVIEPHPHPVGIALAEKTTNVRYKPELVGQYDVLIATDVFEHVPDPLLLLSETAKRLNVNGHYLIANCFLPVIKCHLPQTFHFRKSWDLALKKMGMEFKQQVCYGAVYSIKNELNLHDAKQIESKSIEMEKKFSRIGFDFRGKEKIKKFVFELVA